MAGELSKSRRVSVSAAVFAALVSVMGVAAFIVNERVIEDAPVGSTGSHAALACIVGAACTVALYFATVWAFRRLDARPAHTATRSFSAIVRKRFLLQLLVIVVCWAPVFLVRWPGNGDMDTFYQLPEFLGLAQASNHHPWFDTLVFGAFWKIGTALGDGGTALLAYGIVQGLITACSLSLAVCYLRYLGFGNIASGIAIAFFALYPIVPQYAQTMAKDPLFGWTWILYLLLLAETVRTRGRFLKTGWRVAALVACMLLVALTKKTGIYIVLVDAVVLFAYCNENRLRQLVSLLVAAVVYFGLWNALLLPAMGVVDEDGQREMMSVPAQQTALLVKGRSDELTARDWAILEAVYDDPRSFPEVYRPTIADNTKNQWRLDASGEDVRAYIRWYLGEWLHHPGLFAAAWIANAYPLFLPDGYITDYPIVGILYYPAEGGMSAEYDGYGLFQDGYRTPEAKARSQAYDEGYLAVCRAVPPLFGKCLFGFWIPLFALAYALHRRSGFGIVVSVPAVLTFLALLVGPVIMVRYLVGSVYMAPLLLGIACMPPRADDGRSGRSGRSKAKGMKVPRGKRAQAARPASGGGR